MKTAVILATGPSLTKGIMNSVRLGQEHGLWSVFGMNHLWRDYKELDHFLACNPAYYDTQWNKGLNNLKAEKWTWDFNTASKYGINYIKGRWADGFSKDRSYIHYGHSSGFQLPQIAVHQGFKRLLLCGYDMKFAPDYDGLNKRIGSYPRHYFGEYEEKELSHWPSHKVKNGEFIELIEQFEKVSYLNPEIEIINCTAESALTCFPFADIYDFL